MTEPTHEINDTDFWIEESIYGWGWSNNEDQSEGHFATRSEAVADAIRWVDGIGARRDDVEEERRYGTYAQQHRMYGGC